MNEKNLLNFHSREEFRAWLQANGDRESECWLALKRGKPTQDDFCYLDAVEEALCFGWIDSTQRKIDGVLRQRFSPRREKGLWTELNKERVRRLERLGLMTEAGRAVLPPMEVARFRIDPEIEGRMRKEEVWDTFLSFPPLYQRIRAYNVAFYKGRDPRAYERALSHLIEETRKGRLFGEWNDYGRLLEKEPSQER